MLSKIEQLFMTWLAVYPVITLLSFVLRPLIEYWPLPLQTLLLSAVMVPTLALLVFPKVTRRRKTGQASDA